MLTFVDYFAFSTFTVIRMYAILNRDWKPLVVVIPLALVKPILAIVSFILARPFNHPNNIDFEYEDTLYVAQQAGPPFGCVVQWVKVSDDQLAKCVIHQ